MNKNILKGIGAIIVGFLTVVLLSVGMDFVLESSGVFPGQAHPEQYLPWMLVVALAYRCAFTILGGYVTAKLSPDRPMSYVRILAIIGLIMATLGMITGWSLGNQWYPIGLVITAVPCIWLGAKLALKK